MPRQSQSLTDPALLQAALEGLEIQKQRLEEQIQHVRSMLGGRGPRKQAAPQAQEESGGAQQEKRGPGRPRRRLSAAARKRIAAAQKKRWAEFRKGNGKKSDSGKE